MQEEFESLIDRIYECAYIPELWPTLLDDLSHRTGAWGGMLFTATPVATRWIASEATSEFFHQFLANGWMTRNPLVERGVKKDHAGFLTDLDLFSLDELDHEPMYQDMRRLGGGWHLGTSIAVPNGDTLVINIEGRHDQGPFSRAQADYLDVVRPHLCRAALLAARHHQARTHAALESLELLKLAAGALGPTGRLLAANSLFLRNIPALMDDTPSRIRLTHKQSDKLLFDLLNGANDAENRISGRSIPVPASDEKPPCIVHVVPIRGASRDIFNPASFLIVVTEVELGKVPDAQLVRGLFDLSPAESKIAQDIAKGMNVPEIATLHSLSANTIKTQIKSIFAKTGVSRQSELSALLNGISLL